MAKVLVSLVSDQTIPNIRLIKEYQNEVDRFLFISTKEMEQKEKTQSHLSALNIPSRKVSMIIVDGHSLAQIEESLLTEVVNDDDEYLVNITGGTKPMSIVAMSFFSVFSRVKIYYVPIGEGVYRQVYPRVDSPAKDFLKKINLNEYLLGHNLELIKQENKISRNITHAQGLLEEFILTGGVIDKKNKVNRTHAMTNSDDKVYYSGGWFEELIYTKIKKYFSLNENQIAYNIKLVNQKSNNEYDVVFVYNDSIYIVECKAYKKSNFRNRIEKDLYKLGALDDDFGLKAKAIFITTADIKGNSIEGNYSLSERAKTLKVQLFQLNDLKNDKFLTQIK